MKTFQEFMVESGDWWHPDPAQDRLMPGRGPKLRAREDQASSSQPKENPRKLKPGESYMDFAKRHGYKPTKEEVEIDEGMTMKDFKANRKKLQRRAASADARKRGHEGKEWHNTGRTYSPDEAKANRAKMRDADRAARHRVAVDPDDDRDNIDRKSTRLNSSHVSESRMPSSA